MEYLPMYSGQFSARVYNFQRASLVIVSTSMAKCCIHVDIIEREFFKFPFQIIIC